MKVENRPIRTVRDLYDKNEAAQTKAMKLLHEDKIDGYQFQKIMKKLDDKFKKDVFSLTMVANANVKTESLMQD